MKNRLTILIADRNPRVRDYLKREMLRDGYQVRLAQNGQETLEWSFGAGSLHLLIIDPDLPDMDAAALIDRLANRIPSLPMIIHAFRADYPEKLVDTATARFVEKEGGSIESIRQAMRVLLERVDSSEEIPNPETC